MDAAPTATTKKARAKRATAAKPASAAKKAKAASLSTAAATAAATVGSGRAAAQGVTYVDAPALPRGRASDDVVELKGAARADSEAAAIALLGAGGEPGGAFAAFDLSVFSPTGDRAHLHTAPFADPPLTVAALVARSAAERATGLAVSEIGPVTSFRAVLSSGAPPAIVFTTAAATYVVHKPAAAYKKTFGHVVEMVSLCCGKEREREPAAVSVCVCALHSPPHPPPLLQTIRLNSPTTRAPPCWSLAAPPPTLRPCVPN